MSDYDIEDLKKLAEAQRRKIAGNKEAARQYLIELGIFTPKGNLRKPYKHLCIPQDRAQSWLSMVVMNL